MRDVAFACRNCSVALTDFLRELSSCSAANAGEPMVPAGHFVRVDRTWSYRDFVTGQRAEVSYRSADGDGVAFEVGDFLVDPAEVQHRIRAGAS